MNLFKKEKSTDEKFEEERRTRALTTIIRMFRNDKLKLPDNDLSRVMKEFCDQIDPGHKMPERELIQKLSQQPGILEYLSTKNDDEIIDVAMVKAYADRYYKLLREVIVSPESNAWDTWGYQSQQTIAVLSLKNINIFRDYLRSIMDADPTCPFYVKKVLNDLLIVSDSTGKVSTGRPRMRRKLPRISCVWSVLDWRKAIKMFSGHSLIR